MKHIFLVTLILLLVQNTFMMENASKNYIKEISQEQLNSIHSQMHAESDAYNRQFLQIILEPHKADINRDRKISPSEVKELMEEILLPKGPEAKGKMHPEVYRQAKAGIDLFVSNIRYNMNYKQFQHLLTQVKTEHFIDAERVKANKAAYDLEIELPEDL